MNKKHTKPIKRSFSAKISENDFSQSFEKMSEKPSDGNNSDIELSSDVSLEQSEVVMSDVDMVVEDDDEVMSIEEEDEVL